MIIETDSGQRLELPDGYNPDQIEEVLSHAQDSASPDFSSRESTDIQKRDQEFNDIQNRAPNQAYTSTMYQNAGNVAGRAADLAGNVIGSGARYVGDLIPQSVGNAAGSAISKFKSGATELGQDIANTPIGGKIAQGMATGQQGVSDYLTSHPELSANLDATANLMQAAPLAKPVAATIGGASSMIGGAGNAIGDAFIPSMGKGVADIAQNATKAGLPLTVDQVAPNSVLGKGLNALKMLPLSGSNAPAFQKGLNTAVMKAAGMDSEVMTAPALQERAKELGDQFKGYTDNKVFPSAPLRSNIPTILNNVPKDVASQLRSVTDPLLEAAKAGPISGEDLDKARIAANELIRSSDDYGTKQAAGKLQDAIVNSIVGNDPAKAGEYKKLLGDYKAYKTVEDTYAQSKAGNVDPTAFQQAVMRNYGGDKALIDTDMGKLAKAATTYGNKPGLPWKVGRGVAGMLEAGAAIHSPEIALPAMAANRAIQYWINRNPSIVGAIMNK